MVKKQKQVPTGVKIISVLSYICAGLFGLFAIFFLLGIGAIDLLAKEIPLVQTFGMYLLLLGAIVMLAFGALSFFVGRGLWKAQSWARIVAIVFLCLGAVESIIFIFQGDILVNLIGLFINVLLASYLLFNKKVKKAFV